MDRYKSAQLAAGIAIVLNGLLGVAKILVGVFGNSSALVADGVHSLSDLATSVAVLVGLKVAEKPADADHPYGHGRAESIAGKTVAIALIIVALWLVLNSAGQLATPHKYLPTSVAALWMAAASVIIKEAMFQYKIRVARKTGSTSIEADAWHHRSDSFSSIAAFIGIGAAIIGGEKWAFMDHAAAIVVAVIILWVGASVFRKTWAELMDAAAPQQTLTRLRDLALEVDGVLGVEKIFARKSGLDIFVDIHIEVDPQMTVRASHDIATAVRNHIREKNSIVRNVLVHVEPHGLPKGDADAFEAPDDIVWRNFGC